MRRTEKAARSRSRKIDKSTWRVDARGAARVRRPLSRLRLGSDGARRAPRRHPRLLERRLRVSLRRSAARRAGAREACVRRPAGRSPSACPTSIQASRSPSSRAELRRAGRLAVRASAPTSWSSSPRRAGRTAWPSGASVETPRAELTADFTKIVDAAQAVFGERPLLRLHLHALGRAEQYGGLEHARSLRRCSRSPFTFTRARSTKSSSSWSRTSSSICGTSSASIPTRWARSTTSARPTPARCG